MNWKPILNGKNAKFEKAPPLAHISFEIVLVGQTTHPLPLMPIRAFIDDPISIAATRMLKIRYAINNNNYGPTPLLDVARVRSSREYEV